MRGLSPIPAAVLLAATTVEANLQAGAGVLHLPLTRRNDVPNLARRGVNTTDPATLANNATLGAYLTTVSVGTPAQQLTLQVDTGSSDTWVPPVNADICKAGNCTYGSFDPSKSSSFKVVGPGEFNITYGDGTHSTGDYFTDDFSIGGAKLSSLTMGLGNDTDIPYGLVGVGYALGEATEASTPYVNLPLQLVNLSIIESPAYSLWLNDLYASTGSILFGGVDTAKFQGQLTRLDIQPDPLTSNNSTDRFLVYVSSISATSASGTDNFGSKNFPLLALLDSGTSFTLLPQDLVDQIWHEVGIYETESGIGYVPCDYVSGQGTLVFGLGGPNGATIKVGMQELVIPPAVGTFPDGSFKGRDACAFGVTALQDESDGAFAILGDTFLRSAYVVYDLSNNEIGIGQTIFNTTQSNVVAFASSGAPIPSATPAPSQAAGQVGAGAVTTSATSYAAAASFTSVGKSPAARVAVGGGLWVSLALMLATAAGMFV